MTTYEQEDIEYTNLQFFENLKEYNDLHVFAMGGVNGLTLHNVQITEIFMDIETKAIIIKFENNAAGERNFGPGVNVINANRLQAIKVGKI